MAASINLKIDTNFAQASADLKAFGNLSEAQAAKIEKYVKSFKSEQLDAFEQRQKRTSAAIKATRGPVDALTSDYKAYQRRIEQLIKNGLDPESDEVQRLVKRYKQLSKEIDDATKAEKKHEKASALNAASMVFLAGQAINVAEKIFDIGKVFVDAASDAEETQNKFDVVFRDMKQNAEDTATALADGFGLSEQAAKDLLAGTGDLLAGFGFTQEAALELSTDVQNLAGDLASFQNLETADVSDRITKALTGETESLKALGVVIRQDTKEYKDRIAAVMEAENVNITQAKSLVNLAIITEQSANAIGDFARSQDSFANQTRIAQAATEDLKAAMGEALLPVATNAVTLFGKLARNMADNVQAFNDLKSIVDEFEDTGRVSGSLDELIAKRQTLIDAQLKAGRDASLMNNEEIAAITEQIKLAEEHAEANARANAARVMGLSQQAEAAEKQIILDGIEANAKKELDELLDSRLTKEEKQIAALQEQIDLYAQYKDVPGVQKLINELVAERNGLLETETEETKELLSTGQNLIGEALVPMTDASKEMWRSYGEGIAKAKEDTEDFSNVFMDNFDTIASVAGSVWSSLTGFADSYYDSLLSQYDKDSEEYKAAQIEQFNVSKAINATNAAIAGATGAVEAYKALAGIPVVGPGLGIAAATAMGVFTAAQVASILAQQPSFETGTLPSGFTVPESASTRVDSQSIRVNPGEQVNVSPRGEGGSMQNITIFQLDDDVLFTHVQDGLDSGRIIVSSANITQRAVN